LRLQKSLKVAFSVEFEETIWNICCVVLFQWLLFGLFTANSWKSVTFANKPDLQWGLKLFWLQLHLVFWRQLCFVIIATYNMWTKTFFRTLEVHNSTQPLCYVMFICIQYVPEGQLILQQHSIQKDNLEYTLIIFFSKKLKGTFTK